MEKISCCFLFMLAFLVGCQDQPQPEQKTDPLEDENLPVISSAEELKTIKGKKIIWKKDEAKMTYIPADPDGDKKSKFFGFFFFWLLLFYFSAFPFLLL